MKKRKWITLSLLTLTFLLLLSIIIPSNVIPTFSPSPAMAFTDVYQVSSSSDDADKWYDGAIDRFTTVATTTIAGYGRADYQKCVTGMRFQNIQVEQGSTITSAYLTLRARNTYTGAGQQSIIYGQDSDDANAFTDLTNFNARLTTTATMTWNNITGWVRETW